jgi:hypothetical protein
MSVTVSDIYEDVRLILGACSESFLFRKITDAVEVLANSGDFDPLIGFVDICVTDRLVTLPREIDIPLAVNIGGKPTIGRGMGFRFHLNGLGDCDTPCEWSWDDQGLVPTYADIATPAKLVAAVHAEEDENSELRVYGYDDSGIWVRTKEGSDWKNGYLVPTVFGVSLPDVGAPTFSRVVRIRKARTIAPVRLSTLDISSNTGALLGAFAYDETDPQYRRIKLNRDCDWVRVMFRRRVFKISAQDDLIPLPSQVSILMMIRAMKFYDDGDLARATACEATARRWITEAQDVHAPDLPMPMQVNDRADMFDKRDNLD